MKNKYSKENVSIGDRVLVSGCDEGGEQHWGTVIEYAVDGINLRMDNRNLFGALGYITSYGTDCYYAYWSEVHDLIKVGGLSEAKGIPTIKIIPVTEPDPLSKVVEDLMATHRYLEQVTGKKYSAVVQGVALDTGNGYDSNEVTIKFIKEEK